MNTFGDLKEAVKRFVYNNTNAQDAFQGEQTGATMDELIDGAILRAANNARKYAEKNASFSSLEVTVPAFFPKGMGVNLDRLYLTDEEFDVSAETDMKIKDLSIAGITGGGVWANGSYFIGELVFGAPSWFKYEDGALLHKMQIELLYLGGHYVFNSYTRATVNEAWVNDNTYFVADSDGNPDDVTWTNDGGYTGLPVVTATFTDGMLYRFDGKGILYFAIAEDLVYFWGSANKAKLQSFLVVSSDSTLVPVREYTAWTQMDDYLNGSMTYKVFRVGYRDASIVRPTAWSVLDGRVGPAYFCDHIRLNELRSLVYSPKGVDGAPIEISRKGGEHNREMDRREHITYQSCSYGSTTLVKALIEGRTLSLNLEATEDIPVKISGTKWMADYTQDSDTDFLLEDGFDFLQWQTIIELNYIVQIYVTRAEGTLSPPEKARNEAWGSLIVNDAFANSSFYTP